MQGYCVRCRTKQNMLNATRTHMKNGRRAMIGLCECCGTKMSVAGKWDVEVVDGVVDRQGPARAPLIREAGPKQRTTAGG